MHPDPEMKELLAKLEAFKKGIKNFDKRLAKYEGMNIEEFDKYYNEAENFSPEAWEKLNLFREELAKDIAMMANPPKKKSDAQLAKEQKSRKGKTLGARKQWMPIR